MKNCFDWSNSRPFYQKKKVSNGIEVDLQLIIKQEKKSHRFIKRSILNQIREHLFSY